MDELTQMIEVALAEPTRIHPEEDDLRLLSASAVRRALPRHMRISQAAVRALQEGVDAYACDVWLWARRMAHMEGRTCPRPEAIRLGARIVARH